MGFGQHHCIIVSDHCFHCTIIIILGPLYSFKSLIDPTLSKKSGYTTSYTSSGRPAQRGKTIGRVNHGSSAGGAYNDYVCVQ